MNKDFPIDLAAIQLRIEQIDPRQYAKTRNFADGAVTRLGPYISRGVVSTRQIMQQVASTGIAWHEAEKLYQELAWRDYWQQVWRAKGDGIEEDLKKPQERVEREGIPTAIVEASTGIEVVDNAIRELYETGYMHNHMRMYVASICCNVARCHWREPARWMYSHLLDGDLASNHLSWQWVAGSNANKKYYANQDNINKYFGSNQRDTFLDLPYEAFDNLEVPSILKRTTRWDVNPLSLPKSQSATVDGERKTLVYNYYNLDPFWHQDDDDVQRVLLLEPSVFETHQVSQKTLDFALQLASNIADLKVVVGEFEEVLEAVSSEHLIYKEHPLNAHYRGVEEPREWMSDIEGYFPSFFGFWKKCKKKIKA